MTGTRTRSIYTVRLASASDHQAIVRFNGRLAAGGLSYRFPGSFALPGEKEHRTDGYPVFRELLVAEDASEIRAGVLLQHGTFFVQQQPCDFCWLQLPLAESLVDRTHAPAFSTLMRAALRRAPFSASLGIGSMEEPYARFLKTWNWKNATVPFLFYPAKPSRVFLGLSHLRRRRNLRIAADMAAYSGLGALLGGFLGLRRAWAGISQNYRVTEVPAFGDWTDDIFWRNLPQYVATPRRDAQALNILYPPSEPQYIRLRVQDKSSGGDLGWLLLLHTPMRNNKYFGDLNVGTIVTGFADPAHTGTLIHAGLSHLTALGADIVVANWSHHSWLRASRRLGFIQGPSNFLLFVSPEGSVLDTSCPLSEVHLSRGDCDAPSSLMKPRGEGPSSVQ